MCSTVSNGCFADRGPRVRNFIRDHVPRAAKLAKLGHVLHHTLPVLPPSTPLFGVGATVSEVGVVGGVGGLLAGVDVADGRDEPLEALDANVLRAGAPCVTPNELLLCDELPCDELAGREPLGSVLRPVGAAARRKGARRNVPRLSRTDSHRPSPISKRAMSADKTQHAMSVRPTPRALN